MRLGFLGISLPAFLLLTASAVLSQPTPRPFPRPDSAGAPAPPAPSTPNVAPAPLVPATGQSVAQGSEVQAPPSEDVLGLPVYPAAQFIASYDAGRGQRYYLFGVTMPYSGIVNYYSNILRSRGNEVYDEPPVHIFEVGRFREDTMAFPPSITVKDYTWGGTQGYQVPLPGGDSQWFPTIIQVVPVPPEDR